jgi:hypothetical protein
MIDESNEAGPIGGTELTAGIRSAAAEWDGRDARDLFTKVANLFVRFWRPAGYGPLSEPATIAEAHAKLDGIFRASLTLANRHGVGSDEGGRQACFALSNCMAAQVVGALLRRPLVVALSDLLTHYRSELSPEDVCKLEGVLIAAANGQTRTGGPNCV